MAWDGGGAGHGRFVGLDVAWAEHFLAALPRHAERARAYAAAITRQLAVVGREAADVPSLTQALEFASWCERCAAEMDYRIDVVIHHAPAREGAQYTTFVFDTREEAVKWAGDDAKRLRRLADDVSSGDDRKRLLRALADARDRSDDPVYAATVANRLGPKGMLALLEAAWLAGDGTLCSFGELAGSASRSGLLDPKVADALFSPDNPRLQDAVRCGRFDPATSAAVAARLLGEDPLVLHTSSAEYLVERAVDARDVGLSLLERDPAAAHRFAVDHDDVLTRALAWDEPWAERAAAVALAGVSWFPLAEEMRLAAEAAARVRDAADEALRSILRRVEDGAELSDAAKLALAQELAERPEDLAGVGATCIGELMESDEAREELVRAVAVFAARHLSEAAATLARDLPARDPHPAPLTDDEASKLAGSLNIGQFATPIRDISEAFGAVAAGFSGRDKGPDAIAALRTVASLFATGVGVLNPAAGTAVGVVNTIVVDSVLDEAEADRIRKEARDEGAFTQRMRVELERIVLVALYAQQPIRDALVRMEPRPPLVEDGVLRLPAADSKEHQNLKEWLDKNPGLQTLVDRIVGETLPWFTAEVVL